METWKPIPGYEGIYEASDLGQIRTCLGKVTSSSRFPRRVWAQRVLKPKTQARKSGKQDRRVSLWKDGEESTYLVARLVAMAFLEAPYNKLTVNHKNGNPLDNRVENLEWVTCAENIQHGFRTGLYAKVKKKVNLTSVSSGETISFESMADASRWLGKNIRYVSTCSKRKSNATSENGERYTVTVTDA